MSLLQHNDTNMACHCDAGLDHVADTLSARCLPCGDILSPSPSCAFVEGVLKHSPHLRVGSHGSSAQICLSSSIFKFKIYLIIY